MNKDLMLKNLGEGTPALTNWFDLTVYNANPDHEDFDAERNFNCNYSFVANNQQYTINRVYYGIDQGGNERSYIYFTDLAPEQLYVTYLDIITIARLTDYRLENIDLSHLETYCPNKNNEIEMQVYKDATYLATSGDYNDRLYVHCYAANSLYANMYSVGRYIEQHPDLFANGTIHKMAIFTEIPYWGYTEAL